MRGDETDNGEETLNKERVEGSVAKEKKRFINVLKG